MSDTDKHYGENCPEGMVQVAFVCVDPKLRIDDYKWKPSDDAMLDIYVDGNRYNIRVGNVDAFDPVTGAHSVQRGLRIIGPFDMVVNKDSLNAFSVHKPKGDK